MSVVFCAIRLTGSVVIDRTWSMPAALSLAVLFWMSVSWSQQGWQVRPSWKYSRTVLPRSCVRLTVPPVLAARLKPGAA
jgi:hypothetical protein